MNEISQTSAILKLLRKAGNKGVPNYAFPAHRILKYSSRISELRQDGYNIYCERVVLPNGRSTNTYRYYLQEETVKKKWYQKKESKRHEKAD